MATYYFVSATSLVLFIVILRVVAYTTFVFCIAALIASRAGTIYAVWLKHAGPDTALSLASMIDTLLMVVIGGMGTIWGQVTRHSWPVLGHPRK